jgi:ribosome-associated toxin RatA of RatAB toxin-antitoxin module
MKKVLFAALVVVLMACSKGEQDEINNSNEVIGKWVVTSYRTSEGYFTTNNDGEFFEFKPNNTCTHYNGNILNIYEDYEFEYLPASKKINCIHEKGWDISIQIEFESKDKAVFYITGKTANSNRTVKVSRT